MKKKVHYPLSDITRELVIVDHQKFTVIFDINNNPIRISQRKVVIKFGIKHIYNTPYWHASRHPLTGKAARIVNAAIEQRKSNGESK